MRDLCRVETVICFDRTLRNEEERRRGKKATMRLGVERIEARRHTTAGSQAILHKGAIDQQILLYIKKTTSPNAHAYDHER
jgi:hypothetical protein